MAGRDGSARSRRNGGGLGLLKLHPVEPPELDMLFSRYVLFVTYMLMAVTGFGYLALTWSTVVLLGGFVTALQEKDFWCLTIISMMQAARIFNDLADNLLPNFFNLVTRLIRHNGDIVRDQMWHLAQAFKRFGFLGATASCMTWARVAFVLYGAFLMLPFLVICYVPALLYLHGGPIACIALALWRVAQRDYGADSGDKSKANLTPALDVFYALVLLQGGLYLVWLYVDSSWWAGHLVELRDLCKLPNTGWCHLALIEYLLLDTGAKCSRDLSSIYGRKVIDYAVELLDTGGSMEGNLTGLRLLDAFIRQGTADVRSLLLPSRPKVQKLIDMLGWRHGPQDGASKEMRRLAAHVLVHLAGDIHLSQFPGAIQCISSLLQEDELATMTAYWNPHEQQGHPHPQETKLPPQKQAMLLRLEKEEQELEAKGFQLGAPSEDETEGSHCNKLILHGLTILERLAASNHHNCSEICSTPGLLQKITAPLYSDTLIKDKNNRAWDELVKGSFRVVRQLIHAQGNSGKSLHWEFCSNKQAVSTMESILVQWATAGQELTMESLDILTELAMDPSANLTSTTRENLIKKQLQFFLNIQEGEGPHLLKVTAGRALVLTTTNSQINFDFIMRSPHHDDIIGRLTGLLGTKMNVKIRTIAAEILENLCTHCDWNKYKMILKESLLPKVLTEIMSIKTDQPERKVCEEKEKKPQARRWVVFKRKSNWGNKKNSAAGKKEEKQKNSAPAKDEENQQNIELGIHEQSQENCARRDNNEIQEISSSGQQIEEQTSPKELQEALLSLALAICGKLISAGDVVSVNTLGGDAFVVKLKTIVDDNCQPTADSLRIVRLCSRIAGSVMKSQPYTEHYNKFVRSLCKASEIMSTLGSCIMFSGTDFGHKKMVRPLLSEVVSEL